MCQRHHPTSLAQVGFGCLVRGMRPFLVLSFVVVWCVSGLSCFRLCPGVTGSLMNTKVLVRAASNWIVVSEFLPVRV